MKELNIQKSIQLHAPSNVRLLRNNTGRAWQGIPFSHAGQQCLKQLRPINFGLAVGSSDLIGWTTVEITQDMVGEHVAIFTAIEVKTEKGRPTKAQQNFIQQVHNAGGIAGVCRSVEDMKDLIKFD